MFKELSLEGEISQLKQHVRERDSQLIQLLQVIEQMSCGILDLWVCRLSNSKTKSRQT